MSTTARDLERLVFFMGVSCVSRYADAPIPGDDDKLVIEFLRVLREGGQAVLSEIKDLRPFALGMLGAFFWRSASAAVREGNRDRLFLGLEALGIAGRERDARDLLQEVCVFYDACARIGIDTTAGLRSAIKKTQDPLRQALTSFAEMPSERASSLEDWRVLATKDNDGFRYRPYSRGIQ